jgi:hypothetical protein
MEPSGDKYGRKKQEGQLGAVELWRKRQSRSFEIRDLDCTKPKSLYNNQIIAAFWIETVETKMQR